MTLTLILLAALVLCACGLVAYRARWLGLLMQDDPNRKLLRYEGRDLSDAERRALEEVYAPEDEEQVINPSVKLTDEEAHRVLGILFPERRRASGGKPS